MKIVPSQRLQAPAGWIDDNANYVACIAFYHPHILFRQRIKAIKLTFIGMQDKISNRAFDHHGTIQ
jgi:hypothetical protein